MVALVRRSSPRTVFFSSFVRFTFLAQRPLRAAGWPWATHHIDAIRSRPTTTCQEWDAGDTRSALGCAVSPCANALRCVLWQAVRVWLHKRAFILSHDDSSTPQHRHHFSAWLARIARCAVCWRAVLVIQCLAERHERMVDACGSIRSLEIPVGKLGRS